MDINIDFLIQEGKEIRKELTYVKPTSGVWRLYDVFALKNPSKYYIWSATCFRFLTGMYPNENIGKIFQDTAAAFEHKNNHFCPAPLEKMIGILESCKALPTTRTIINDTNMSISDEILAVEKADSIYQSFIPSKYNSIECIKAYLEW